MLKKHTHHRFLLRSALAFAAMMLSAFCVQAEELSPKTIAESWTAYGKGAVRYQNRMLFMQEAPDSSGVMVVSTEAYSENITLRYELMPMNAASVCVAILSASDNGEGTTLTLPEDYDGGMGPWTRDIHNYFFAFHNAAHDRTPFAVRFPGGHPIGEYDKNVIRSGAFHNMEIVQRDGNLTLAVNGLTLFKGKASEPLRGGHIAFRIRGINGMAAACLIRNITITEE